LIKNEKDSIQRLNTIIKVWHEWESTSNEQYIPILLKSVNILLDLTNSLHVEQVKLPSWKIWSEPIVFKFCYHVSSIALLFKGTQLPFKSDERNILIFDEPSVIILFRAALENYLTFFYLFIDDISDEEKEFRMLVWRYCGLKQRTEFVIDTEKERQKQLEEVKIVENLKTELLANSVFTKYPDKQKKILLDGKKARLFESWKSLINKSKLSVDFFQNLYGYKSNYSHTEFISVLQLHEGQYGHHSANNRSHYMLFLLHGLIAKFIIELKDFLPSIGKFFDQLEENLKKEIIYLNEMCSTKVDASTKQHGS
jgi:hypothetical protein